AFVNKNYIPAITEFVNPYIAEISLPLIHNSNIKFELFPSYEHGERKVFILYPEYYEDLNYSEFICGIRVHNKSKFKKLNHKDYLGSIMSLGIDRNKSGDIYVYDEYADIVIHNDIADFIVYNLEKIGHNKVEIEKIDISNLHFKEQEHILLNINSSSLRLDNIVKHLTNKSREVSSSIIKSGDVKVNWQVIDKTSYIVNEKDMLSISKYGRFKVSKNLGLTKSNRVKIEVKYYV
ncbi:MAG: YlmH/Sll1252 family protein, partial [Tissierellia bacterium]|nr:YlmH/Sll1252 family protein [Tissierellia bacterium]